MNDKIVKSYHLFFYKLVEFTCFMNRRHYNYYELKNGLFGASIALTILCSCVFWGILLYVGSLCGNLYSFATNDVLFLSVLFLLLVSIYILVYGCLICKEQWLTYEKEFKAYPRKKNKIINRNICLIAIGILIFFCGGMFLYLNT